jgi:uncharacterized delta-60 repeat protein
MEVTMRRVLGVLAVAFALFAPPAWASSGALDPSFDGDGKVLTDFATATSEETSALALQRDGRIVVAGRARVGGRWQLALARYREDGSLDGSFDGDGKVLTDVPATSDEQAQAVAFQGDGKIVAAGFGGEGAGGRFVLARYNRDGSLDRTFGAGGIVVTDLPGATHERAAALVVAFDGRITVAGQAAVAGRVRIALARYLPSGPLDRTFGTAGIALTDVTAATDVAVRGLVLDRRSRAVIAGYAAVPQGSTETRQFLLARHTASGALDTAFGSGGIVLTDFATSSSEEAAAIVLAVDGPGASDDRIVAAGRGVIQRERRFALARYREDGSLDSTFDRDGKVLTDFASASDEEILGLAALADGRLVTAGHALPRGSAQQFALARYREDGSLDSTFDGDGKVLTNVSGVSGEGVRAVAIQPDGKTVVAGYGAATGGLRFALARYLGEFDLRAHGFAFRNSFNQPIGFTTPGGATVNLANHRFGLCGGMVFAALDTYNLGRVRPGRTTEPAQGSSLRSYVYDRMVDTLNVDGAYGLRTFLELQRRSQSELDTTSAREFTGKVRPALDRGQPVPLGLVLVRNPSPVWDNHQVLATGHFRRPDGERVLELYDPNFPDEKRFLFMRQRITASDPEGTSRLSNYRGFFSLLASYEVKTPPW